MYKKIVNSYGESYYDHACSIDYDKDVLDVDIQENNFYWWTRLRRWWSDLFLLSYSDERSRSYYRSSHSMRMERMKQFRYHRASIHPFSKFRNFWECLLLSSDLLSKALFHHSTSILYGELTWEIYFIGVICEAIILTDLFVNMLTGYIVKEDRSINLDVKKSILNYCSTKLFLHFVSSLPLQSIMFLKYGKNISCSLCKCNTFVYTLRLVGIVRLYRLYDAANYWNRERSSFRAMYFFKFLRIAVLGLSTMLLVVKLVDTISLLAVMHNGKIDPSSYFLSVVKFRYDERYPLPNVLFYTLELARVLKSFLLFSFGLKPQIYYWDKMASLISFILANVFYLWNLIECHGCLSRIKYPQEQMIMNKYRIVNLLRWRQLSDDFCQKVLKYHNFNMTKLTITEKQNGCFHAIPASLKKEIIISSYGKYMSRIPYFYDFPQNLIEEIVLLLIEEVYLESDVVVEASLSSDGLIIVDVGVLAVRSSVDNNTQYLIDGDYFGEISLVTDESYASPSVVAMISCKLLFLDKNAFRNMMRRYPKLFFAMKEQIVSKFSPLKL
ncbi:PREDICTED: potassium/sodium hyperpolarization-activated cyclic nucleotide-gated channel 2-like [Papilio xuthus]|uniref:Potassium/sodium hyperpolarization-activated cyclic nucleotide-gated channel 2-like n=1 Tax=Papilio xuthus TaxID=66420 RepID=A0AAJ7EJD9_PAPXU|nr:PREDICTED: potassium/sodium hyperpolarization-activated cyclic nucleotide-gated channel 2-like [Papilio xuthus]